MIPKNISFIGLNYAPEDTAIGLYSSQWVAYLQESGYKVTVVTAFPYYPQWEIYKEYKGKPTFIREEKKGLTVLRYKLYVPKSPTFFKRIIHLIDFTLGSIINLFKIKECDIVISVVPFTSSVLLGYIQKLRFKSKMWIHIQDFEFDAAFQTGVGQKKKKSLIFSLLLKLEKWLFSKADISSTISQSMLKKLRQKSKSKLFYLPNWIDEDQINPETSAKHEYLNSDKTKILYAGNIGDKQDWETFLRFCNDIDHEKFDVVVVGNGSKKDWVVQQIENFSNVYYYEQVPYHKLSDLLCSADIHILFQKNDVIDTVMPSKVLGMMASAKPSIIIGNKNSELKTILEESQGGLFFTDYSPELIREINQIADQPQRIKKLGENARTYVLKNYSKGVILSRFIKQLQDL